MYKTTRFVPTEEALARQLAAEGFHPGTPPHISHETRSIDARVCRCLKCGHCKHRGCAYRPFTDGRSYRVLAVCQHCQAAEEL